MIKKLPDILIIIFLIFAGFGRLYGGGTLEIFIKKPHIPFVQLAYYYGPGVYLVDTLSLDQDGHAQYTGNTLPAGIYLIVFNDTISFEFMISGDQDLKIEFAGTPDILNMSVSGNRESEAFNGFLKEQLKTHHEIENLKKQAHKNALVVDSLKYYKEKIDQTEAEYQLKLETIINNYPGTFLADYLSLLKTLEFSGYKKSALRNGPVSPDKNIPSDYLNIYFEQVNFYNPGLIRTPLLYPQIEEYLKQIAVNPWEEIIEGVNLLINKSSANEKMYQYILTLLFNHYYTLKADPVNERVYIQIAQDYYLACKAPWADSTFIDKLSIEVDRLIVTMLGAPVPPIVLTDLTGKEIQFPFANADYQILYFWDSNCKLCTRLTQELFTWYISVKNKNIKVVSIQMDTGESGIENQYSDSPGWIYTSYTGDPTALQKLFNLNYVPALFLIGPDNRIVAKYFQVGELDGLLE
ncbi:MAG: thioredoxin family protein [Bacteroidales bacterium]|nr:thioredoxin family protein [Bacteroidales bacterium]